MTTPEKITLTKEQETLLIPLFAKARGAEILDDAKARQILAGVEYDFARLKVPKKTVVTLCIRARQLDTWTREFIQTHPDGLILHLGCGLDSRCLRVPRGQTVWYDLDMPDVIELRRKFFPETETYRMIASSVTDLDWVHQVNAGDRKVFVVAEGLFMYLTGDQVREIFRCLRETFSGCHLVFDAFSQLTADRVKAHPSLRKTGAVIQWGIDDPHEIERWGGEDGRAFRLKEEWFFSQSPEIERLDPLYRWMFRLSARIPAAQRAQRLLYFV